MQHVHLLVVSVVAVFLRGAVLGLLTNVWGWPATGRNCVCDSRHVGSGDCRDSGIHCATTTWKIGSGDRWRVAVVGLVAISFLLRLFYIGQVELLPEDSYYWNYSQHLDLGYLDHPPMVAWLIWLGTHVFGGSEFGVRIGALCCAARCGFFLVSADAQSVWRRQRAGCAGVAAGDAVLLPGGPADDARCAAHRGLVGNTLFPRTRACWGAGACLVVRRRQHRAGPHFQIHHRDARAGGVSVCAPRPAFTPVVVPLAAVCGVGDCRPDFLAGDPLERAA